MRVPAVRSQQQFILQSRCVPSLWGASPCSVHSEITARR